jgi:hypothetical protein
MEKYFLLGPCFGDLILKACLFVLVLDCFWNLLEKRDWGEGRQTVFQILSGDRGKAFFLFLFSNTNLSRFRSFGGY